MFTPITIAGETYKLRYPGLVQITIMKEAGKRLGIAKPRPNLSDVLNLASSGDIEAQAYLLWQGIIGGMPERRKMKFDEAVQFRDDFIEGSEPDDGSRYLELLEILATAIDAAAGADRKKALEKAKVDQAKAKAEQDEKKVQELKLIYKAQMLAKQEIEEEEKASIGSEPGKTVAESSD